MFAYHIAIMVPIFAVFLLFLAPQLVFSSSSVRTTSGNVVGHPARNRTDVTEYLGVRYAEATSGTLRFQPPVAFKSSLTYEADEYVRYLHL